MDIIAESVEETECVEESVCSLSKRGGSFRFWSGSDIEREIVDEEF